MGRRRVRWAPLSERVAPLAAGRGALRIRAVFPALSDLEVRLPGARAGMVQRRACFRWPAEQLPLRVTRTGWRVRGVPLERVLAEKRLLRRPLRAGEVVRFRNENPFDCRGENLVVVEVGPGGRTRGR